MSRRPDGRRGRRKPDPAEETASWLLEVEQAGQTGEEEEDWADALRATRREATGQFPAVPFEGPAGGAPPADPAATPPPRRRPPPGEAPAAGQENWFGSERSGQPAGPGTESWGGTPAPPSWEGSQSDPRPTPGAADLRFGSPAPAPWRQPEAPSHAEPLPQEPQAWDTQADGEPWNGHWPFENTSQSSEPDDRSYTWPAQELPSNTGSWEAEPAPPQSEDPWATPQSGGYAPPTGYEPAAGYQAPLPSAGGYAPDPGYAPDQGYAPDPGYPSPSGYERTGYEQAAGGYSTPAAGYEPSGGYEPAAGYAPPAGDPHATRDPYATGEQYPVDDPYATRDPYATGDPYPARDPYATGDPYATASGAHGGADAGAGPEPRRAADPYAAAEPYPGSDPFAAYGLGRSSDPYGTREGTQAAAGPGSQTAFDSGQHTGPIGTGPLTGAGGPPPGVAGHPSAHPPRPETWPPQTGSWGLDEPPPRPRSAASGEFSRVLGSDEEQVVRLGRSLDDEDAGNAGFDPGSRVQAGRSARSGEARLVDDGDHVSHRSRWPRVVALVSWIILLMVLCWFYVFPWLEKILPENF